jgi:hypothetical protein
MNGLTEVEWPMDPTRRTFAMLPWARRSPTRPGTLGHRNRLRYLEIVDGVVYIELTAELVTVDQFGGTDPLVFVRAADGVELAASTRSVQPESGPSAGVSDVTATLRGGRMSILLRNRDTEAETRIAADTRIDATPDIGTAALRQFIVRFSASASFDLTPMSPSAAPATIWSMFTTFDVFGMVSLAPIGTHRDRVMANRVGAPSDLPDGRRARASLLGSDPQLLLQVTDRGRRPI